MGKFNKTGPGQPDPAAAVAPKGAWSAGQISAHRAKRHADGLFAKHVNARGVLDDQGVHSCLVDVGFAIHDPNCEPIRPATTHNTACRRQSTITASSGR